MVSLLAEKFVLSKRACLICLLMPFINMTFWRKMLTPEPGNKRQWNISCEEILCMFCCKSISIYCFQLFNLQHLTVASDYFMVLFSIE